MDMNLMDELGVEASSLNEVKAQTVSAGFVIPSDVYKAKVTEAFIRKTDSGANMLELTFNIMLNKELTEYRYSTCVKSGCQAITA